MSDFDERKYWQTECLKKGFEYVREPDDHYVVADVSEMVSLLRDLLGVDVRQKDGDDYGVSISELEEEVEGLVGTIHMLEGLRADAERYRFLRNSADDIDLSAAESLEELDSMVDAAMSKEPKA